MILKQSKDQSQSSTDTTVVLLMKQTHKIVSQMGTSDIVKSGIIHNGFDTAFQEIALYSSLYSRISPG